MYAATPPPTSNTDDQRPNQLRRIDAQQGGGRNGARQSEGAFFLNVTRCYQWSLCLVLLVRHCCWYMHRVNIGAPSTAVSRLGAGQPT
jgi:hypothetical protein